MSDDPVESAVREHVLDAHGETVAAVVECADAVAGGWDGDHTTDRAAVADALEHELRRRGVLSRLPGVLVCAVDAAGFELRAPPVPAPPYVAVTSTGPVLRATVSGGRLVVFLRVFAVERGDLARYRRRGDEPAAVLDVAFRG